MDSVEFTYKKYIVDTLKPILDNRVSFNISDETTQSNILKNLFRTVTMFIFIAISVVFIYYASTDPDVLTTKTYMYGLIIVLPLMVGIYLTTVFLIRTIRYLLCDF